MENTVVYHHAPAGYRCPFCLFVQGIENEHVHSVQTDRVYHDDTVTAFISAHQWRHNEGHVLVVPNQHYENIYDLPLAVAAEIHRVARAVARAMKVAYGCSGISTRQHNEPAGNQDVWHYHLHVFPRYPDDHLYTSTWRLMAAETRAVYADKLRTNL